MASTFEQRQNWLMANGLLEFEAYEFADAYRLRDFRELPYFRAMLNRRRRYIRELRRLGLSDSQIADRIIANTYYRRGWTTAWDLLRYWRKGAIEGGEYFPVKRKGTHHPPKSGVSKGDLQGQRKRRKKKMSDLEKYERGRGR